MRNITLVLIKIYQIFSKNLLLQTSGFLTFPSSCKFHPSCSEYALESYKKYNFVKASVRSILRILKCNPWSKPGVDLP